MAARNSQVGDVDWKKYHDDMLPKMAVGKLREAMRTRDHAALKKSMEDCEAHGIDEQNEDYKKGRKMLDIFLARQNLKEAMANKDAEQIYKEIDSISEKKYVQYLQAEMTDASRLAQSLSRKQHQQKLILDMDKKTISEVRRYHKAPPVLHKVMQGSLLLLGEDEGATSDWKHVQRLMNPQGQTGLNRRILEFDSSKVHPEICARSRQILEEVELKNVQAVSAGAGTFYVWTMGVIEEADGGNSPESSQQGGGGGTKPASLERQLEIFGRTPPKSPRKARRPYAPRSTPRSSQDSQASAQGSSTPEDLPPTKTSQS